MKKFLGILGAVIAAAAIYFGIMFAPEIKDAFLGNTPEPPTQDVEEPGEPTGDVVADVQNSDALRLTKHNRVSANGQALSVTATLSPDYIVDKTVTWSIAWKSTNSANVNDYITITPSADTLTCTVAVKKAFSTQIILTCTAKSNTSVKATCTIDYVDRNYKIGQTVSYVADMNGKNPFNTSLLEVVEMALNGSQYADTTLYTTYGGSLRGTIKNVEFKDATLNFDDIIMISSSQALSDDNLGEYIVQATEQYTGSLTDSINYLKTLKSDIRVQADIYYGNTLIAENVIYTIEFINNISTSYFTADGLTLNDTQLIF